jgi:hypothetical protein
MLGVACFMNMMMLVAVSNSTCSWLTAAQHAAAATAQVLASLLLLHYAQPSHNRICHTTHGTAAAHHAQAQLQPTSHLVLLLLLLLLLVMLCVHIVCTHHMLASRNVSFRSSFAEGSKSCKHSHTSCRTSTSTTFMYNTEDRC